MCGDPWRDKELSCELSTFSANSVPYLMMYNIIHLVTNFCAGRDIEHLSHALVPKKGRCYNNQLLSLVYKSDLYRLGRAGGIGESKPT